MKDKMTNDIESVLYKFRSAVPTEQYESIVTETFRYGEEVEEEVIRYGSTLSHRGFGI